jgi:hypothetical protein
MKIKNKKSGYIGEVTKDAWEKMATQYIPNSQTTSNPKGVSFQTLYTVIEEPKSFKVSTRKTGFGMPTEYKTTDETNSSEN